MVRLFDVFREMKEKEDYEFIVFYFILLGISIFIIVYGTITNRIPCSYSYRSCGQKPNNPLLLPMILVPICSVILIALWFSCCYKMNGFIDAIFLIPMSGIGIALGMQFGIAGLVTPILMYVKCCNDRGKSIKKKAYFEDNATHLHVINTVLDNRDFN